MTDHTDSSTDLDKTRAYLKDALVAAMFTNEHIHVVSNDIDVLDNAAWNIELTLEEMQKIADSLDDEIRK